MTLDKDAETLSDFGLTFNQAKVYLAALQLGLTCVAKISKESGIRREDVYRTLPKLEKLGLIERRLGTPARVKAGSLEKALSVLMNNQKAKLARLKTKKEELLKNYQETCREHKLVEEENQFVLLSEKELILHKIFLMMKKATEQVDVISTSENLFQYLPSFARPLQKKINNGIEVRVRVILDMERSKDPIGRIQEKMKAIPSGAPVEIKYSHNALNPLVIVDGKEVLMGTSVKQVFGIYGEYPYLWSTNQALAGLLQKSFEEQWHHSAGPSGVVTKSVTDKAKPLVEQLRPMDHVMFLYETQEAKHNVLFNYLEAGLRNKEIGAYVASDENPDQIRAAMKRFGIDVERHENKGALRIFSYDKIYIVDGRFSPSETTSRWKSLYDEALSEGFRGLRVAGEMGCFFKHDLLNELAEYEQSLHRVFELPMIGICAYRTDMFTQAKNPIGLYNELLRNHRMVLLASTDNSIRKYEFRSS